jgi:hypothetical protein
MRDGHSSRTPVTRRLQRPTRTAGRTHLEALNGIHAVPIRSCSRWGLPCRPRCRRRGALLPHLFTLAAAYATRCGGLFSVALSLGSRPPDVIRHRLSMEPGLSSPVIPLAKVPERPSDRLTRTKGWGCCLIPSRGQPAEAARPRGFDPHPPALREQILQGRACGFIGNAIDALRAKMALKCRHDVISR